MSDGTTSSDGGGPAQGAGEAAELRAQLAELRAAVEELRQARTPQQRREARATVAEEKDDLEQVLRKHGYKLSRADLDELVERHEDERFRARLQAWLDEQARAGGNTGNASSSDGATAGGKAGKGSGGKQPASDGDGDGQQRGGWLRMP